MSDEGQSIYYTYIALKCSLVDVPPLEDCSEFFTSSSSPSAQNQTTTTTTTTTTTEKHIAAAAAQNDGFAGMKKGFLNKGTTSKKKTSDDIPFIKPSKTANTSNLQIPEVQEALRKPLLGTNGGAELPYSGKHLVNSSIF